MINAQDGLTSAGSEQACWRQLWIFSIMQNTQPEQVMIIYSFSSLISAAKAGSSHRFLPNVFISFIYLPIYLVCVSSPLHESSLEARDSPPLRGIINWTNWISHTNYSRIYRSILNTLGLSLNLAWFVVKRGILMLSVENKEGPICAVFTRAQVGKSLIKGFEVAFNPTERPLSSTFMGKRPVHAKKQKQQQPNVIRNVPVKKTRLYVFLF